MDAVPRDVMLSQHFSSSDIYETDQGLEAISRISPSNGMNSNGMAVQVIPFDGAGLATVEALI